MILLEEFLFASEYTMNVQSELVSVALVGRFLCRLFDLHGCAMIEYMVCFVGFVCGGCWREGLGLIFGHFYGSVVIYVPADRDVVVCFDGDAEGLAFLYSFSA